MRFLDLPTGAKKALVQYFGVESGCESFREFDDLIKLSDSEVRKAISLADSLWGDQNFSLKTLTTEDAKLYIVSNSPDLRDDFSSFDDHHSHYLCEDNPNHKMNDWPVLAQPSVGEALLDGWHRFHSYVNSGFKEIHFVMLDSKSV